MCHADENWSEILPLVLLGIRSAWKEDLSTCSAELVYGEPIRLPSDFMHYSAPIDVVPDYSDFLSRLRSHTRNLQPSTPSHHGASKIFVFKDLSNTSHVFLQIGRASCRERV